MAIVVLREKIFAYAWMNLNEFENDVISSSQLIYINIYLRDCKHSHCFNYDKINLEINYCEIYSFNSLVTFIEYDEFDKYKI